jgi:hypothetical protein
MNSTTTDYEGKRIRRYRRVLIALFALYVPVAFSLAVGLYLLLRTFFFSFVLARMGGELFAVDSY